MSTHRGGRAATAALAGCAVVALTACGDDGSVADRGPTTTRVATTYLVATTAPPPTTIPVSSPPTGDVTASGTSAPPNISLSTPPTEVTPPVSSGGSGFPPVSSGGSGGPPVSGGASPVSFTADDVCTEAVDGDLVDDLPMDVGATGPVVVTVQQRLEANGFSVGAAGADGRFGKRTDSAYRAWERATGGTETGIVCQEDYDALLGPSGGG